MVKNGHALLEERRFRNRSRPGLGIEVFTLAELRRRLGRDDLTAALITAGQGSAVIDFETHRFRPGTLLHVRPGQVQRLPRTHRTAPPDADGVMVLFTPAFVHRPGLGSKLGTDVWHLDGAPRQQLRRSMNELAAEYRHEDPEDPDSVALLRHLLAVVLIRITRLPRDEAGTVKPNPSFALFRQEVDRSFTQTRRVADYAARPGYSARTLTRLSLAATGRPAKQMIDDRVALEAKRLLAHTDRPVASIARTLGFSEATNFGKFFRAQTGRAPSDFRADERSR